MSRGLNQYRGVERIKVIVDRIRGATGGLGYLAAMDAATIIDQKLKEQKAKEAERYDTN